MMRVNLKYAQAIGGDGFTQAEALSVRLPEHIDASGQRVFNAAILSAVRSGDESVCELRLTNLPGKKREVCLRVALRVLARASDRYLVYCSVDDVTQEREAELLLIKSSQQLEFLNDVFRSLLNHANPDQAINETLWKVMGYFAGERAYVFEFDWKERLCRDTYEVCAPDVKAERDDLTALPFSAFDFWFKAFENRSYIHIKDIDMLSYEREEERQLLTKRGIRSLIAVPLRRDGRMIGFIGVDNPSQNVEFMAQLKALGDYMAIVLTRRDFQDQQALHVPPPPSACVSAH